MKSQITSFTVILILILILGIFLSQFISEVSVNNYKSSCETKQLKEKIIVIVINNTIFSDGEYLYYELLPNETE